MSITAIPVIVVVMIVRLLLKRLPKRFSYVLWALVAFRLIVPVSISSEISIFNLSARISNLNNRIETVNTKKNLEKSDDADIQIVVPDIQGEVKAHEEQVFTDEGKILKGFETATGTEHNSTYIVDENNIIIQTATIIWILGIMILVSYSVIVYLRMKRRIRYSIWLSDTVYECDCIRSPFVLGIVRPKIYILFRLDEKGLQQVTSGICVKQKATVYKSAGIWRREYHEKSEEYITIQKAWEMENRGWNACDYIHNGSVCHGC